MDSFLPFFSFIFIVTVAAAVVSHGETPGELYWNSVLPNTPMPSAIKLLSLTDGGLKTGMASVGVSNVGGVNVDVGKGNTSVNVDPTKKPKKPQQVVVTVPKYGPFMYRYAASDTQLKDDPNAALFFLEKDLHPGTKMNTNFNFTYNNEGTTLFLSRQKANSIPFSSSKLNQILTRLSIEPGSTDAHLVKKTLRECEDQTVKEEKECVTSLQSMVEFSTEKLGTKQVRVVSTEVNDKEKSGKQEYRIEGVVEKMKGKRMVVCHAQPYAYAVFYCHVNEKVSGYKVRMEGEDDGGVVEAVGLCHEDTRGWNKEHLAFKVLKVKPGTVPVCHFLPQDHVVWAVKQGQE